MAAAAVIVVIVAIVLFNDTEEASEVDVVDSPADVEASEPTEPGVSEPDAPEVFDLPDFGADPVRVGDALTAAQASGDGDLFESLFAPGATVTIDGVVTPVSDIRPDDPYVVGVNQTWEWTNCRPLGPNEGAPTAATWRVWTTSSGSWTAAQSYSG